MRLAHLLLLLNLSALVAAQCTECVPDPGCTSTDGFPTICPELLPDGQTGTNYEEVITFFLPAQVSDPGSGAVADLESVTITAITGLPLGLEVQLSDPDGTYEPQAGQTSGCATLCGVPAWPGDFVLSISISAVASLFAFEQVVSDSFTYDLHIEAGPGGTGTFTVSQTSGCDSLTVDLAATVNGGPGQTTSHSWNLSNGALSEAAAWTTTFGTPGTYTVTLATTISEPVLTGLNVTSTGGAGLDDFFTAPDLYFILTDGSGNAVYTSGSVTDTSTPTWNGLSIPLINPPYALAFWDSDTFGGDDNMGSGSLNVGTGAVYFNAMPTTGTATIALTPVLQLEDSIDVFVAAPPVLPPPVAEPDGLYAPVDSMLQFAWMWGDSTWAAGPDSTFLPPGNGWVAYAATNASGCSAVSDSALFCGLTPAVDPVLMAAAGGEPETVVANEALSTYVWATPAGVDTTDVPVLFPAVSGWYVVGAWDQWGCAAAPDSLLVCWPVDAPDIVQETDGDLACTPGFFTYLWYQNGMPLAESTSTLPDPGPGNYTVEVTDHPDCPAVTSPLWIYVGTEHPLASAPAFEVFPIPFTNNLSIQAPTGFSQPWHVQFFDASGKAFSDASKLPVGSYLLKIFSEGRCLDTHHVIKLNP